MIVYLASGGFRLNNLPDVKLTGGRVVHPKLPHADMPVLLTFYHERDPNFATLIHDKELEGIPTPDKLLPALQSGTKRRKR